MNGRSEFDLYIIDDAGQILGSFSLAGGTFSAFCELGKAYTAAGDRGKLHAELTKTIEPAIQKVLPYDLRLPSDAQISYAIAIARALRLAVPPDVFSRRGAMHEFLDQYVPAFKAKPASADSHGSDSPANADRSDTEAAGGGVDPG
ncbi:MAG: hypothetical protein AB7E72_03490 [Lysobacterales bacterium]